MRNIGVLSLQVAGISIAQNICKKIQLICRIIKDDRRVEVDVAHLDAEGIEHRLDPQTIKSLEKLIPILKKKSNQTSLTDKVICIYREINAYLLWKWKVYIYF